MLASLTRYSPLRVYPLSAIFVLVLVYVWLRCLWILDRLSIYGSWRRFLFPAIVLPSIVFTGYSVAHWFFAINTIVNWPGGNFIGEYTLSRLIELAPLLAIAFFGLRYVLALALPRKPEHRSEMSARENGH
jgi:hypothetical protein